MLLPGGVDRIVCFTDQMGWGGNVHLLLLVALDATWNRLDDLRT